MFLAKVIYLERDEKKDAKDRSFIKYAIPLSQPGASILVPIFKKNSFQE